MSAQRVALPLIALAILLAGCWSSKRDLVEEASAVDRLVGNDPTSSLEQDHEFGTVLAAGQLLAHQFTITNPTGKPIQLLSGKALTPCCSSIGPIPRVTPPYGEAKIPVALKAGYESDDKRVVFTVATDDNTRPIFNLSLRARFVADWEIDRSERPMPVLRLNESGSFRFRIVARRMGDRGRRLPETLVYPDGGGVGRRVRRATS